MDQGKESPCPGIYCDGVMQQKQDWGGHAFGDVCSVCGRRMVVDKKTSHTATLAARAWLKGVSR